MNTLTTWVAICTGLSTVTIYNSNWTNTERVYLHVHGNVVGGTMVLKFGGAERAAFNGIWLDTPLLPPDKRCPDEPLPSWYKFPWLPVWPSRPFMFNESFEWNILLFQPFTWALPTGLCFERAIWVCRELLSGWCEKGICPWPSSIWTWVACDGEWLVTLKRSSRWPSHKLNFDLSSQVMAGWMREYERSCRLSSMNTPCSIEWDKIFGIRTRYSFLAFMFPECNSGRWTNNSCIAFSFGSWSSLQM